MRRALCSMLVVAAFASFAAAQDSIIFMDARSNAIAANTGSDYNAISAPASMNGPYGVDPIAGTGGKRGNGQSLILEPIHNDNYQTAFGGNSYPNLDGDGNRSTGDLWVYMDVIDNGGGSDDVVSSVGLDFDVQAPAGTVRNNISNISFTWDTPAGRWNGQNNGAISGTSPAPDWNGAKAVAVPVTTGPVYNSTGRVVPNFANIGAYSATSTVAPYRLGRLRLTANTRVCAGATSPPFDGVNVFNNRSTFNVFMKVNNLLVTRVFATGADADGHEDVSFGFNGATPDAAVNGNTNGAVSATADAVVSVRMKGDWNGNGTVNSTDTSTYLLSVSDPTDNPLQDYLGDYTPPPGSVLTANNLVNSSDTAQFLASFAQSTTCP